MKLGLLTAILEKKTFEETIDIVSELGFQCVEVACWPNAGVSERRYAGTCHIDCERILIDEAYKAHVLTYAKERNIEYSSLGYYPNVMDANKEKSDAAIDHLKNVIKASAALGINMVTTFIGRDQFKTLEENLEILPSVWCPILDLAKSLNVRVAIENCPMLFGTDQWPGGQNLMTTPVIWKKVFEILPYDNLGINYDPSHFVWQQIDYIAPLYEFKDKIFHVHYKDIKMYPEKLARCGVMAYPLDYMSPKLPGLGDVDWGKYVSALTDIRYNGYTIIEVEDKAFEDTEERILDSVKLSKRYMEQFVI